MRGNDAIWGQDSLVEVGTLSVRRRLNLSWIGCWDRGVPMKFDISQHGDGVVTSIPAAPRSPPRHAQEAVTSGVLP